MDADTLAPPSIFDLLARSWETECSVSSIRFDGTGAAVAFALADGRIALARTTDSESAESRVRVEADSGRSTIRMREHPVPPLTVTERIGDGPRPITALDHRGFVTADASGALLQITPRGQLVRLRSGEGAPVGALASQPQRGRMAVALGDRVIILDSAAISPIVDFTLDAPVTGLAFDPAGQRIAIATGDNLALHGIAPADGLLAEISLGPLAGAPVFSADGAWLTGRTAAGALWLWHPESRRSDVIGNFPMPPTHAGFNTAANALFASGAYRLAAWSLDRPPFDGDTTGAMRTGRAALIPVTAAATHPIRDLAAAGNAQGAVVLNRLGQADELSVRVEGGGAVTALAWSPDGKLLAVGDDAGSTALVSFPRQIFK